MHDKGKLFISGLVIGCLLVISAPYLSAMDGPDFVELETMVNIYESVAFDHAMHVDVGSCATCHHHTTGLPAEDENCLRCHKESGEADEVACTGCHSANLLGVVEMLKMFDDADASLYHSDRTGLKRAYHLNCMGCHKEMDAPNGCEDCHLKRDDGDNLVRAGN